MPRTQRNRIIEAADDEEMDLDPSDFAEETEESEDDGFGMEDAENDEDSYTTEEVAEQVRALNSKKQAQVQKSKKGRAAPKAVARARTTASQKVAQARAPVRARQEEWKPADTLDAPPPRPGMEHRWVRFRIGNDDDQKNFSAKQRGGWAVRKASTVPEGYYPPTMRHAQMGEVIAVGDLILCERLRSIGISQRKYFREKLKRQTQAGQRHIRKAERSDHPIDVENIRERPSVGYGKKRRVTVQDDGE